MTRKPQKKLEQLKLPPMTLQPGDTHNFVWARNSSDLHPNIYGHRPSSPRRMSSMPLIYFADSKWPYNGQHKWYLREHSDWTGMKINGLATPGYRRSSPKWAANKIILCSHANQAVYNQKWACSEGTWPAIVPFGHEVTFESIQRKSRGLSSRI